MKRLALAVIVFLGLIVASCATHEKCPSFIGDAGQVEVEHNV